MSNGGECHRGKTCQIQLLKKNIYVNVKSDKGLECIHS